MMLKKLFNIKIAYSIVFLSLIFWAFFAYFTMSQLITSQEVYAKLINISGKQRMLSQKTTLMVKRAAETKDKKLQEHLLELLELMKKDHDFLLRNLTSPSLENIYFQKPYDIDRKVKKYFTLLESFIKNKDITLISDIENYSFILLPNLDHAVYEFEKESEQKTYQLKKRELFILAGTLLTIILEALLIILPSIKRIESSEKELKDLNENLENKVQEQKEIILKEQEDKKRKEKFFFEQSKLLSMGEMIGNIAHQWRQPLSVISTAATGIKIKKELQSLNDEELLLFCDNINNNAQYLSRTIDDFRNFMKGSTEKTQFNLKNNIETFLELVRATIKIHNINVIQEIEEDINVKGYPDELVQCFINLFNNAKDALNESREKEKYLFITGKLADKHIIIEFKDNAGGIPLDIIDKIFEPYFTTKHPSLGTGLGLHMTYNLITKGMGGTIEVQNKKYLCEGKIRTGAVFTIKIPING